MTQEQTHQAAVIEGPDGTPLRADGTPYAEASSRNGQPLESREAPAEPAAELAVAATRIETIPPDPQIGSPEQLTVDESKGRLLYMPIGHVDSNLDRIPFVCLPIISAFAELAVVEAQVTISENVDAMKNSTSDTGNGRLAVETLTLLFNFFQHYMFPTELERLRHLMGAKTETYGTGRIIDPITRDQAVESMKAVLELYGTVEATKDSPAVEIDPKEGDGS